MDRVQLLLGSIIVLVICLVVILTNRINNNKQPMMLKVLTVSALAFSLYMYSTLDQNDVNEIKRVSGGEIVNSTDILASDMFTQLTTPM
jgi:hypothetical protein